MMKLPRIIGRAQKRLRSIANSDFVKRLQCRYRGHDFPDFYLSPGVHIHCRRCGDELLGRTADELEPLSEFDREYLDWREREMEEQ